MAPGLAGALAAAAAVGTAGAAAKAPVAQEEPVEKAADLKTVCGVEGRIMYPMGPSNRYFPAACRIFFHGFLACETAQKHPELASVFMWVYSMTPG